MLSVSINQQPGRVTSYQGFKSASWFSDPLSVLIICDVSHMQGTWCQLLKQLFVAFLKRKEGKKKKEHLDYLFITV